MGQKGQIIFMNLIMKPIFIFSKHYMYGSIYSHIILLGLITEYLHYKTVIFMKYLIPNSFLLNNIKLTFLGLKFYFNLVLFTV